MKNKCDGIYNNKFVYFLAVDKIKEQHGFVPEELKEYADVVVSPNEKLNCGIIGNRLVSLDWCGTIPTNEITNRGIAEIVESFEDEEVYAPFDEVIYKNFISAGLRSEEIKLDAVNLARALGFALNIINRNKKRIPAEDLELIEDMRTDLLETL